MAGHLAHKVSEILSGLFGRNPLKKPVTLSEVQVVASWTYFNLSNTGSLLLLRVKIDPLLNCV
jgi:hypothetical protein